MLKLNGNGIYQVIQILIKLGQLYGKIPPIWEQHGRQQHGNVNSNYGYQWKRK